MYENTRLRLNGNEYSNVLREFSLSKTSKDMDKDIVFMPDKYGLAYYSFKKTRQNFINSVFNVVFFCLFTSLVALFALMLFEFDGHSIRPRELGERPVIKVNKIAGNEVAKKIIATDAYSVEQKNTIALDIDKENTTEMNYSDTDEPINKSGLNKHSVETAKFWLESAMVAIVFLAEASANEKIVQMAEIMVKDGDIMISFTDNLITEMSSNGTFSKAFASAFYKTAKDINFSLDKQP